MTSEETRLKIQALADNELPEQEIPELMEAIRGSYDLRAEYVELLRMKRRLGGATVPEPSAEWFERLAERPARRAMSRIGLTVLIGSYVVLLAYAVYSLFADASVSLLIRLGAGGAVLGALVVLAVAVADRVRESKSDKYREVTK